MLTIGVQGLTCDEFDLFCALLPGETTASVTFDEDGRGIANVECVVRLPSYAEHIIVNFEVGDNNANK